MRLALVLVFLLPSSYVIGFMAPVHSAELDPLSLGERPVTNACLTDPPPATDTFNVGMCKTLLGLDEEQRDHLRAWAKNEIPGCDAVCRYHAERDVERAAQSTTPAVTHVTNFPFPPEAQACLDSKPSASNDPAGALRCIDILEVAYIDRVHAMYVAQHPETQACRDNPPLDPARTSRCRTLMDQEYTAVAHKKDKLRVDAGLVRTSVMERAAKKAARDARKAERLNNPLGIDVEGGIERLDREIAQMEAGSRTLFSFPFPVMREPILIPFTVHAEDLGNLSANEFDPNSIANPFGAGSPFSPNSVTNEFGIYGSPYSNRSATNPYATEAPRLYDQQGNYRGELSANPYNPDSVSNPYGRYGNPYSPDSLNNQFGAGNPYRSDSPNNPYGQGWRIEGR